MKIVHVSDAAGAKNNEDLITVYAHNAGIVDILIFDGASSVSEKNYFDTVAGDAAWFVSAFAVLLSEVVAPGLSQDDSIKLALAGLQRQVQARLDLAHIPAYAYPIAAVTWARIVEGDAGAAVQIYALGDCKVFVSNAAGDVRDIDPYENAQEDILKAAIAQLTAQGIEDKAQVFAALLPMLRERRAFQNLHAAPGILCMYPQGEFKARQYAFEMDRQSQLLAMTDGFYRLVDTYGLYSMEGLVRRCRETELDALLRELRQFERDNLASGAQSVKKSDDASAVRYGPRALPGERFDIA
ncbi:hypothetical protein CSQ90_19910 [Janthinobacterium sp. BJB303]|nr:hypothetical protein CSQ90_19910 [Janthinobacterium sp. BJB303]